MMGGTAKSKRKTHFEQGARGVSFKNGKFYEFTDRHVLVMKSWPDPRAWYKRRSHGWKNTRKLPDSVLCGIHFDEEKYLPRKPEPPSILSGGQGLDLDPGIREWLDRIEQKRRQAQTSYLEPVPCDVRREIGRYVSRRWQMLNLFARCEGSLELSRSNAALAFALANNWVFHKPAVQQPMRAARSLVWKKQRVICEWLGFPDSESVRKTLAKIDADSLDVEMLLYLRQAIANPDVLKMLRHLPRLTREVVILVSHRRLGPHVTPRLLEETLHAAPATTDPGERRKPVHELMKDTVNMAEIVDWERCPDTFCSIQRLQSVHDELSAKMELVRLKSVLDLPERLDDPPFPGTDQIIPLTTPEEVCREGYLQRNCVGSHLPEIISGSEYIYRVEQPVRATASIVFTGGKWRPGSLYKANNEPVHEQIWHRIFEELFSTASNGEWKSIPNTLFPDL